MDDDLSTFYKSLLRSEARHYEDYLTLAKSISNQDFTDRVKYIGLVEAELISSEDEEFRFHSGKPKIALLRH